MKELFIVPEFYVEGKNLHKVLTALSGMAINLQAPRPVINAKVNGNGVSQAKPGSTIKERVLNRLKDLPSQRLTASQIKDIISSEGGHRHNLTHIARLAVENKLLKRVGRGQYQVL